MPVSRVTLARVGGVRVRVWRFPTPHVDSCSGSAGVKRLAVRRVSLQGSTAHRRARTRRMPQETTGDSAHGPYERARVAGTLTTARTVPNRRGPAGCR